MTLVLDLPEDVERRLSAKASARGESLTDYVQRLVVESDPSGESVGDRILRLARTVTADIPETELEGLPTDGAANHDHYLYGAPRQQP